MKEITFVAEPGSLEVTVTGSFAAPRAQVFNALVDPALVTRWWGPRYLTNQVVALEARPGGFWRIIQRDAEGNVYPFHGFYHLVEPPARIVRTFEYEGSPGEVVLETITLEEKDGGTLLTDLSVFQSVASRDAMRAEDMETGARESMERLAELLGG